MDNDLSELNKRLNALEFSQGIIINKIDNLHSNKNAAHESFSRILERHDETLFGASGNSDLSIISRVNSLIKTIDDHVLQDRWGYGIVATILLFILGVLIKQTL